MNARMKRLLLAAPAAALVCLTLGLPASGADRDAHLPKNAKEMFWFGRDGRFGLYRVNPKGGPPLRLTKPWGNDVASVSPNGKTLAFQYNSSLFRVSVRGGGAKRLGSGFEPVWSPNGKRVAYPEGEGIWVMKPNGTGKRKVAVDHYLEFVGAPAWSPDSSKLAYIRCSAPNGSQPCEHEYGFDVYTIRLDGTHNHKVTTKSGLPQCPAWSRKGVLAFLTTDGDTAIVQRNGTLKTYQQSGSCPVWSPSGTRLAMGTSTGILLMDPNRSGQKPIAIPSHSEIAPSSRLAWSADGRRLGVEGGQFGPHEWVVRADGTGLKKVF
jgi:Tol biopolymer transport system component